MRSSSTWPCASHTGDKGTATRARMVRGGSPRTLKPDKILVSSRRRKAHSRARRVNGCLYNAFSSWADLKKQHRPARRTELMNPKTLQETPRPVRPSIFDVRATSLQIPEGPYTRTASSATGAARDRSAGSVMQPCAAALITSRRRERAGRPAYGRRLTAARR